MDGAHCRGVTPSGSPLKMLATRQIQPAVAIAVRLVSTISGGIHPPATTSWPGTPEHVPRCKIAADLQGTVSGVSVR